MKKTKYYICHILTDYILYECGYNLLLAPNHIDVSKYLFIKPNNLFTKTGAKKALKELFSQNDEPNTSTHRGILFIKDSNSNTVKTMHFGSELLKSQFIREEFIILKVESK